MSRGLILTLGSLLLCACSDNVQTTYVNRQDAIEKGLVAKGWLPNFIPASARQIQTSNDLDLNVSDGSFRFKAEDWNSFAAHLKTHGRATPPFVNWAHTVENYKSRGYESWWHEEDRATWVFFCKPHEGLCEHRMWLHRAPVKTPQ